jgi:hypothetical protein
MLVLFGKVKPSLLPVLGELGPFGLVMGLESVIMWDISDSLGADWIRDDGVDVFGSLCRSGSLPSVYH